MALGERSCRCGVDVTGPEHAVDPGIAVLVKGDFQSGLLGVSGAVDVEISRRRGRYGQAVDKKRAGRVRLVAERASVEGVIDFDAIEQRARTEGATADGFADAFDLDLGF